MGSNCNDYVKRGCNRSCFSYKKKSGSLVPSNKGIWTLKGIVSNLRYTEKEDKDKLVAIQEDLGRSAATLAAFILIRKSEAWWNLAQDERRKIMEIKSRHTQTGMKYLPIIARKLFHCRDIGEPFDFLTWFEYAPSDAAAFEELLEALRKTEEWSKACVNKKQYHHGYGV